MTEQQGPSREVQYATPDPCQESLERMTRRLTVDLRSKIRRLGMHEVVTVEWLEMAETLHHLSSVAVMEEKDSAPRPGQSAAAAAQQAGSVWEREELCIRLLVEEGKINMLLRSLNTFKKFHYTTPPERVQALITAQAPLYGEEAKVRIRMYEHGIGVLIRCAMTAVECLQTLDLVGLVEHVALVLEYIGSNSDVSSPDPSSQEVIVIAYLSLMMRRIDNLNEERVMGKILECNIVPKSLVVYEKMGKAYCKDTTAHMVYFLSYTMETETYKTHPAKFLPTPQDKKRLCLLEAAVKDRMVADPDRRKTLRCLSDAIVRCK